MAVLPMNRTETSLDVHVAIVDVSGLDDVELLLL
jgi:hypothetical protein